MCLIKCKCHKLNGLAVPYNQDQQVWDKLYQLSDRFDRLVRSLGMEEGFRDKSK